MTFMTNQKHPTALARSALLDVPVFAKRHFIAETISQHPEKCWICGSCKTILVDGIIIPGILFAAEKFGANWCPVNESTFHTWKNLGTSNVKLTDAGPRTPGLA